MLSQSLLFLRVVLPFSTVKQKAKYSTQGNLASIGPDPALKCLNFVAKTEDDLDTREVDPHVPGEAEDSLDSLEIVSGVQPCVAPTPHRCEQARSLVLSEGLRVNAVTS